MDAEHDDLSGMGDRDDGHVRDLIPAYVLGALDPDDSERVRLHVSSCSSCAQELESYEEMVGLLPYASPARPVPLRARAALLGRIDQATPARAPRLRRTFAWQPVAPRLAGFVVAPALVLLLVIGVMGVRLYNQQQRIAEIQAEQDRTMRTLAEAPTTVGSTYIAQFVGSETLAPEAKAKLIVNRQTNSALIVAVDLPEPGAGEHYVAWMRFPNGSDYARGGELRVDPDGGRATLVIEPFGWVASYEALVVTVEADAAIGAPTGPALLTATIGAQ